MGSSGYGNGNNKGKGCPAPPPAGMSGKTGGKGDKGKMSFIPKLMTGDWWCRYGHYNFAARGHCFKCQESRETGVIVQSNSGGAVNVGKGQPCNKGPKGKGEDGTLPPARAPTTTPTPLGTANLNQVASAYDRHFGAREKEALEQKSRFEEAMKFVQDRRAEVNKKQADLEFMRAQLASLEESLKQSETRAQALFDVSVAQMESLVKSVQWKGKSASGDDPHGPEFWAIEVERLQVAVSALKNIMGSCYPESPGTKKSRSRSQKQRVKFASPSPSPEPQTRGHSRNRQRSVSQSRQRSCSARRSVSAEREEDRRSMSVDRVSPDRRSNSHRRSRNPSRNSRRSRTRSVSASRSESRTRVRQSEKEREPSYDPQYRRSRGGGMRAWSDDGRENRRQ